MEFKYNRIVEFRGRNGYFKQGGMIVYNYGGDVMLHPVTSRGDEGSAKLEIPKEDLPMLINHLIDLYLKE